MIGTSLLETERMRQPGVSDAVRVRAIAAQLIDELEIEEPPVDVKMVASRLSIPTITEDARLVESGCLICQGGRLEIRVRQGDRLERQRFTVCHECGHTFFPGFQRRPRYRCSPGGSPTDHRQLRGQRQHARGEQPQVEQLCDIAAG